MACDVGLVDDLSAVEPNPADAPEAPAIVVSMAEICGYLNLTEARQIRDRLHRERIACDLVIRVSPETPPSGEVLEEYWLRADAQQVRSVKALLEGAEPPAAAPAETGTFKCSKCRSPVREEESFCANCGTRFAE